MKKRIGIDLTYIDRDEVTGIRKQAEDTLRGLNKVPHDQYEFVLIVNEALCDTFKKNFPEYEICKVKWIFRRVKFVRRVNIFFPFWKKAAFRRANCDIIYHPYVGRWTLLDKEFFNVSGILDLIPLNIIEDKTSQKYKELETRTRNMINKADVITTISEYSKSDILKVCPDYPESNIYIVPNAISKIEDGHKFPKELENLKVPYIFNINSFLSHKNQLTLIKAFEKIMDRIPHVLVLVGRPEIKSPDTLYPQVVKYIKEHNLSERVYLLEGISDEERNTLFWHTSLFVTPSMQEGFGRTPVEAAICEVPVISTMETSLPEATKNKVYYYKNGMDYDELANLMLEVLSNPPSKEKLKEIANDFLETYSEENIAKMYLKMFDEITKK